MNVTALVLAFAIQAAQESRAWRIECRQGGEHFSIREDGSDRRAEAPTQWWGLSPDGTRKVWTQESDGDREIWVSDADGTHARKLTDNKAMDSGPQWTADGRHLVFYSNRDGTTQIWIMDADGANPKRLTNHEVLAWNPRVSKTGLVAYEEKHERDPSDRIRLLPATLRTMDLASGDSKIVLEKAHVLGWAWSSAGDQLAVGLTHELRIVEPSGKTVTRFDLSKIHKELYDHGVFHTVWRPDGGALACKISFLGGPEESAKRFGYDQIFILPLEGKPVILEMGGLASPVRWKRE